jgi:repressor LexA
MKGVTMIGERVRKARIEANMTQEKLSAETGLRQFHISSIESGRIREVRSDTLIKLSCALKVTSDYLLGLQNGVLTQQN